ncbi:hypothetical protein F9U64_22085 [Gracilibacillus oryzae]|uniref:Glycoside hydrolase family 42 N-terminal domain-containing protein n=1 Tax=Gracilibacillus oryzae TaxID=1672701 RepID=A0A7C8KR12_9BACI|nr:beta-galactosidase [Gracilibacillus oryzae]KAB8125677.1 hypothetical protein F9U64_22085 [Gracilibacillus oryzae]
MNFLKEHKLMQMNNIELQYGEEASLHLTASPKGGGLQWELTDHSKKAFLQNEYFAAKVFHQSDDVLVIICRFVEAGGRFIQVHFGILPNVPVKICLPLKALNGEKLFLERYPNVMQTVLRGDAHIDLESIQTVYIETPSSQNGRSFSLSNMELLTHEPNFKKEKIVYVDEMGQNNFREWPEKIRDTEQLTASINRALDNDGKRPFKMEGGESYAATGFFRTQYDGEKWWLVNPDGEAFFSIGVNCVRANSPMKIKGMENLLPPLPEKDEKFAPAFEGDFFDFHLANLIRAFGDNWYDNWMKLTNNRLKEWQMNTIGNWSDENFIQYSDLPYVFQMNDFPETEQKIYRDFPDVFDPAYERNAREFAKQLESIREDRRVVGYFMRNEPHWAFVEDVNLVEVMLYQKETTCSKKAFADYLEEKYAEIDRLNQAWQTRLASFADLLVPEKLRLSHSLAQENDFSEFQKILVRKYIEIPLTQCRKVDQNHLNMGIRYAWISSKDLLEGCELFDVFSINCYQDMPDKDQIEYISKKLNMPVIIGEFHFGGADAGLPAYGIKAARNQSDRGKAYRYYVEQGAAIPGLVGVHYFQYNDQPVLGRFDGENYQIGLIDVAQQPYQDFIAEMCKAHDNVSEIRAGRRKPFDQMPVLIPKTGF